MDNKFDKLEYISGAFCGIISSTTDAVKKNPLKKLFIEIIKENGSVIYVYNNKDEKRTKEKVIRSWGIDYDKVVKDGQLVFVFSKGDYVKSTIDYSNPKNYLMELIEKIQKQGHEKIILIDKRDGLLREKMSKWKLYNYHKALKDFAKRKKIMVFIKYILDASTEEMFLKLIPLHDILMLYDNNNNYIYTPLNFHNAEHLIKYLRNIFIDKEQLYKENKKLELLNELIIEISYKQNSDQLLNSAIKTISEIIGVDFGYILNIDEEEKNIVGKYNLPYGFLEDLDLMMQKQKKPLDLENKDILIYSKDDYSQLYRKYMLKKYNIKSIADILIKDKDQGPIGEILLFSTKEKEIFNKHLTFLDAIKNTLLVILNKQKENEEYQNKLIRTEKLRTLGELAGGIAHDFNNVLTSIMGFSQIALTKELDEETKNYIDIIYKSAIDGKTIVNKIQNFSKKRSSHQKSIHKINGIVESGLDMANPQWRSFCQKDGKLEIFKKLKSESHIRCNEHEMREVILNITLNALDALEGKGKLQIRTYDEEDKVKIEIEDNGTGMTERVKEKIFEPFYSTKESKGTGLGLSIVKNIVEDHEGKIEVDSKIGQGTIFKLIFNKSSDRIVEYSKNKELPKFKNLKTLVIDDREDVAKSISKLLSMLNVKSKIETDSYNITNRLKNEHFDFLICDLEMPGLDGVEIVENVKRQNKKIKFILMTGWPNDIKTRNLEDIDYILSKPCTIEELAVAVERVIKTH